MKLKLNREYALRHLGVTLLALGLSGWFAYDGYVNYPRQDEAWFAERHLVKDRATRRQRELALVALVAALVIGARLYRSYAFRFEFDGTTYTVGGKTREIAGIKSVDRSRWTKKGIIRVDGVVLDAWHHEGVEDFVRLLDEKIKPTGE